MSRSITVLVTGATGLQGGAVARLLLDRGHRVRALTRKPAAQAAAALHVLGADVYEGDLDDASSVKGAARGTDALFLSTTPFEEGLEAEVRQARTAARAAADAGVGRIVYSSLAGADRTIGVAYLAAKREIEEIVQSAAKAWTLIAPTFLMENLLGPALLAGLQSGELRLPLPGARPLSVLALQNLAEVVRLALERPSELAGKRMEVASDRLTGPDMASALTAATEREIEYVEAPLDELHGRQAGAALLWEWLGHGYPDVDPGALRRAHPEVGWLDFTRWARERDWSGLGPARARQPAT
jgi:uncharacterized protein YbjT (DUF2867 family)